MKLGNIRVTIINQEGNEISTQIYDLSKGRGSKHWDGLWKWALHQGYSLIVKPEGNENARRQPPTKLHAGDSRDFPHWP